MTTDSNIIAPGETTYRWMEKADIPALSDVAHRSWYATYPRIISTEQIAYMLEEMYSEHALREQMQIGHRFLLAEVKDVGVVGFISIEAQKDHHFVHKLYICPKYQGKGIGRGLLSFLLAAVPEITLLRLFVNRQNEDAIAFYQRQQFRIAGEKDTDIGNGYKKIDYIMERSV